LSSFLSELWGRALTPLQLFVRQSAVKFFARAAAEKVYQLRKLQNEKF
jgi:hypothetical protein